MQWIEQNINVLYFREKKHTPSIQQLIDILTKIQFVENPNDGKILNLPREYSNLDIKHQKVILNYFFSFYETFGSNKQNLIYETIKTKYKNDSSIIIDVVLRFHYVSLASRLLLIFIDSTLFCVNLAKSMLEKKIIKKEWIEILNKRINKDNNGERVIIKESCLNENYQNNLHELRILIQKLDSIEYYYQLFMIEGERIALSPSSISSVSKKFLTFYEAENYLNENKYDFKETSNHEYYGGVHIVLVENSTLFYVNNFGEKQNPVK